ncbi:MAG: signal peptidase I [Thermoleophilia bacterium]|nr:signal peptidase I [Thermoleophilia bacterium]
MHDIRETSSERPRRSRSRTGPRLRSFWLVVAIAGLVTVCAIAVLLMPVFGYRVYVVTGDSMKGTLDRGALVIAKSVPVSSLKVGDVITFVPPNQTAPVTHRIISITVGSDGRPVFRTKGDHNEYPDPWPFTLDQPTQARYLTHVPHLGYIFALLAIRAVRAVVIAGAGLLLVLVVFWEIWRKAEKEVPVPDGSFSSVQHATNSEKQLRSLNVRDDTSS